MGNSQPKGFTSKSQRLPPLPVKVMLKNVSYEYDVRTGKWRQGGNSSSSTQFFE